MPDYIDQVPFADAEFALNPENRCPCLLLLDTSGSMEGARIEQLNQGVADLRSQLIGRRYGRKACRDFAANLRTCQNRK